MRGVITQTGLRFLAPAVVLTAGTFLAGKIHVGPTQYAAGRIPGSFFRREGRPSTDAILACRLIDRPLRPA